MMLAFVVGIANVLGAAGASTTCSESYDRCNDICKDSTHKQWGCIAYIRSYPEAMKACADYVSERLRKDYEKTCLKGCKIGFKACQER
jgi:hypothetical protein